MRVSQQTLDCLAYCCFSLNSSAKHHALSKTINSLRPMNSEMTCILASKRALFACMVVEESWLNFTVIQEIRGSNEQLKRFFFGLDLLV